MTVNHPPNNSVHKDKPCADGKEERYTVKQCCGSVTVGSGCFWASRIRICHYLYGSGSASFHNFLSFFQTRVFLFYGFFCKDLKQGKRVWFFFFKIRQQKRLRLTWSKRHASFIKFPSLVPFIKQRRRGVVPSENVKIYFKTYVVLLKSLKLFVQRHLYIFINTNLHIVHDTPAPTYTHT
jgi:hypothetical protein